MGGKDSALTATPSVDGDVLIDNTIVIEVDEVLSAKRMSMLREAAESWFPGRKVLVLTKGIRISRDDQLRRIEAKLDAILDALAEEPEEDQSATLDDAGEARRPVTL